MENKQTYIFLITETIILMDGCKFSDKDGLDFTFIWVYDRADRRSGSIRDGWTRSDESERNWHLIEYIPYRIQDGGLTKQHGTEKHRESFIIWPIFDRNFNLQMGKSFNFIFYDPRRSESIWVDPNWSDPDWRSELIRSYFCTCLCKTYLSVCTTQKLWFTYILTHHFSFVILRFSSQITFLKTLHAWKLENLAL